MNSLGSFHYTLFLDLNKHAYAFVLDPTNDVVSPSPSLSFLWEMGQSGEHQSSFMAMKSWNSFFLWPNRVDFRRQGVFSSVAWWGSWHSWMNMRKPKANSGSPHTLRDVRSTPQPEVSSLDRYLRTWWKSKKTRSLMCRLWAQAKKLPQAHMYVCIMVFAYIYECLLHKHVCMSLCLGTQ